MNNRASFIDIVTATFAAGESRLFALTGQYFEIIDASFPVDVTLSDFYGAQRGLMKSAEASFNLKNTEFGVIQITSASAQTIRFAYGTGEAGTRRAAGAVSIVGQQGAYTQAAATVTSASAQLLAAKADRRYLLIQNKDAAGLLYVNLAGAAATAANGIRIGPGDSLELTSFAPIGAVFAIGDIASNANVVTAEG